MAISTLIADKKTTSRATYRARPRIGTLDGWRGVAILLVLVEHTATYTRFHERSWANLGGFGVDIFFVISGYIITSRLIDERKKTGDVSLRGFYLRRAFRILPVVVTYLSVLCILSAFHRLLDFHWPEVLGSALFFRNYQFCANNSGVFTMHFWSLSIEEHFYLLWPALLVWLGNRRAMALAVAGAVSCALWRAHLLAHPQGLIGNFWGYGAVIWRTDARFDGLLVGSVTAILLSVDRVKAFVLHNFPKEAPLFALFLLLMNLNRTYFLPSLVSYLLVSLMLVSTMVVEEGLVHSFLNNRCLVWMGTISYSIYVWQEVFFFRPSLGFMPLGPLSSFPLNLACIFAVSALSYYFLERPFIRRGRQVLDQKLRQKNAEI